MNEGRLIGVICTSPIFYEDNPKKKPFAVMFVETQEPEEERTYRTQVCAFEESIDSFRSLKVGDPVEVLGRIQSGWGRGSLSGLYISPAFGYIKKLDTPSLKSKIGKLFKKREMRVENRVAFGNPQKCAI